MSLSPVVSAATLSRIESRRKCSRLWFAQWTRDKGPTRRSCSDTTYELGKRGRRVDIGEGAIIGHFHLVD